MVVAPGPEQVPESSTRSTRPSIVPKTSMPLRQVGLPERLALVAISGWLSMASNWQAILERGWRRASRPVLPVTFSGTLAEAGTMMVSGPGQKRRLIVAAAGAAQMLDSQNFFDIGRRNYQAMRKP